MPELVRGIDESEWSKGRVSYRSPDIQRHNVEVTVIQAWGGGPHVGRRNEYFHEQAGEAFEQGKGVAAYCWPPQDWEPCLDWIGDVPISWLGLDVESGAQVEHYHVRGVAERNIEPVIYSSPNSWRAIMQNTTDFSDLPLWLARYPLILEPSAPVYWPQSYQWANAFGGYQVGGWTLESLLGWQFRGTTDMAGGQVDCNLFRADAFDALIPVAPLVPQSLLASRVPIWPLQPDQYPTLSEILHEAFWFPVRVGLAARNPSRSDDNAR